MEQWIGWAGTIGSVLITLTGFYMGWRRYQAESLRSRDVAAWADRCIALLLAVEICAEPDGPIPAAERTRRMTDALFTSSALVEQGRLFFRNISEERGATYAGHRPRVLDPLVVAHKIAKRLLHAPDAGVAPLHRVARDQRRLFVQLVQDEIGRRQSASWKARAKGDPSDLDAMIAADSHP